MRKLSNVNFRIIKNSSKLFLEYTQEIDTVGLELFRVNGLFTHLYIFAKYIMF